MVHSRYCISHHIPAVEVVIERSTTGVNFGSEHSMVQRFLTILAFGDDAAVAHVCTSIDRLAAALSCFKQYANIYVELKMQYLEKKHKFKVGLNNALKLSTLQWRQQ